MNYCSYCRPIRPRRPIAHHQDGVYASAFFEHSFDDGESENNDDGLQNQAEPTPHHLTESNVRGAVYATTLEETVMTDIALLKQDFALRLAEDLALPDADDDSSAGLAALCAREAIAVLSRSLHTFDNETRIGFVSTFATDADGPEAAAFWDVLLAFLVVYFDRFSETGWEPVMGLFPEFFGDSMAVWRTEHDELVCDLLTFLPGTDTDADVWDDIVESMGPALNEFGDRLAGIRAIAPFHAHRSRFYRPNGSWTSLFHDGTIQGDQW